jgi:hypothetical protein
MGASNDCNESRNAEDVTESEKIQKELMWDFYQDVRTHARHNETIRSNAIDYMLLVASALIIVISYDRKICGGGDQAFAIILTLIGLIGALFAASYGELYYRNRDRSDRLRKELDTRFFQNQGAQTTLEEIWNETDRGNYSLSKLRVITGDAGSTHVFWIVLPLVAGLIGIVLAYLANTPCPLSSP